MLQISNLMFSYSGKEPYILRNLNLHINEGDYVSILGENGSAKSTLIKLILSLLKPVSGNIKVNTNKIGYVAQRVDNFNTQFPITVNEMLKVHLKTLKIKDNKCIDKALDDIGMLNYKYSLMGDMSGGQIQKIFIARALLGSPKLLILDEPSTGIDIGSQNEIYSFIKHLNIHFGITVISVEHNLNAALNNSTNICVIKDGEANLYTIDEYNHFSEVANVSI